MGRISALFLLIMSCQAVRFESENNRIAWGVYEQSTRNGEYETVLIATINSEGSLLGLSPIDELNYCQSHVRTPVIEGLGNRMEMLLKSRRRFMDCTNFAPPDWSEITFFCQTAPTADCIMVKAKFRVSARTFSTRQYEPLVYDAAAEQSRLDRGRIPREILSFYDDVRSNFYSGCPKIESKQVVEEGLVRTLSAFSESAMPSSCD